MATFYYEGQSREGTALSGTLEAPSRDAAMEAARKRCHTVQTLEPMYLAEIQRLLHMDMGMLLSGGRIPAKKLSLLCSQLAISLEAGMPLMRSLQLAARTAPDQYLKEVLDGAAEDVRGGESLSDAFRSRCPGLPDAFLETIRAGEHSGTLADSFRRLSEYYSRTAATGEKIGSAFVYPALLLLVAAGVIAVILIYAVPVFEESFASMGTALPGPTAFLIALSDLLRKHFLLIAASSACCILSLILLGKTPRGRLIFGALALRLPGVGGVLRIQAAASFSATLSALLGAGLPLAEAAAIAARAEDNPLLRRDLDRACAGLQEGRSFSGGLEESPHLPPLLGEMAALGEETGQLAETLRLVSVHFAGETDIAVKRLLSLLEPCITLLLAVLVVGILLCVYLPIFGMYGGI